MTTASDRSSIIDKVVTDLKDLTSIYEISNNFSAGDWISKAVKYNCVFDRKLSFMQLFKNMQPVNDQFNKDEKLAKYLGLLVEIVS